MKTLGIIFAILLGILAIFGLAVVVFVAICLMDEKAREEFKNNNENSSE